ncbi:MAG: hypothetical protein K8U03_06760 [Planctomycetia bacterium]|nr:hypothetical protein [Planctomycetia bacterium]
MNRRWLLTCLIACCAVGLQTAESQAQVHVDFLFGNGYGHGYHHHHHRPYYGYWGDYYWYAPPVRYVPVAPQPVVYVPTPVSASVPVAVPTAAAPAPTQAPSLQTAAAPNLRSNAVPAASSIRETSTRESARETVKVVNPSSSGGQVSFIVDNSREVTLAPGESKSLNDGDGTTVEFDRGETYGTTRVVLTEGTYEFVVTSSGWDLQRQSSVAANSSLKPVVRRNTLPTTQR